MMAVTLICRLRRGSRHVYRGRGRLRDENGKNGEKESTQPANRLHAYIGDSRPSQLASQPVFMPETHMRMSACTHAVVTEINFFSVRCP